MDEDRRRILNMEVSQIPAFGYLAKLAVKKYGPRKDQHFDGLTRTFQKISMVVSSEVRIKSDEQERYPGFVSAYLPKAQHHTFKSERSCSPDRVSSKKFTSIRFLLLTTRVPFYGEM